MTGDLTQVKCSLCTHLICQERLTVGPVTKATVSERFDGTGQSEIVIFIAICNKPKHTGSLIIFHGYTYTMQCCDTNSNLYPVSYKIDHAT